jgi:hypothetical protein
LSHRIFLIIKMTYIKLKLLFLTLLLSSCVHQKHLNNDAATIFDENTTFTILQDDDKSGTVHMLRNMLLAEGMNYLDAQSATIVIKNKTPLKDSNVNKDLQKAFKIKDLNAIYSIELKYRYYKDLFHYSHKDFEFKIVDLKDGKEILWGSNITHDGLWVNIKDNLGIVVDNIKWKYRKTRKS